MANQQPSTEFERFLLEEIQRLKARNARLKIKAAKANTNLQIYKYKSYRFQNMYVGLQQSVARHNANAVNFMSSYGTATVNSNQLSKDVEADFYRAYPNYKPPTKRVP